MEACFKTELIIEFFTWDINVYRLQAQSTTQSIIQLTIDATFLILINDEIINSLKLLSRRHNLSI